MTETKRLLGKRIIDGLQEAIAGDFASVLIDGRIWVRKDAHQALREAAEAALDYLDREEFPHKSAKGNDRRPVAKKLREALSALDCPQDHRISPEQGQKQRFSRARCESCSHFSAFCANSSRKNPRGKLRLHLDNTSASRRN